MGNFKKLSRICMFFCRSLLKADPWCGLFLFQHCERLLLVVLRQVACCLSCFARYNFQHYDSEYLKLLFKVFIIQQRSMLSQLGFVLGSILHFLFVVFSFLVIVSQLQHFLEVGYFFLLCCLLAPLLRCQRSFLHIASSVSRGVYRVELFLFYCPASVVGLKLAISLSIKLPSWDFSWLRQRLTKTASSLHMVIP